MSTVFQEMPHIDFTMCGQVSQYKSTHILPSAAASTMSTKSYHARQQLTRAKYSTRFRNSIQQRFKIPHNVQSRYACPLFWIILKSKCSNTNLFLRSIATKSSWQKNAKHPKRTSSFFVATWAEPYAALLSSMNCTGCQYCSSSFTEIRQSFFHVTITVNIGMEGWKHRKTHHMKRNRSMFQWVPKHPNFCSVDKNDGSE